MYQRLTVYELSVHYHANIMTHSRKGSVPLFSRHSRCQLKAQ